MIKFYNNFTTQEHAKMLLKLGVPDDSADLYYIYEDEAIPSVLPYKKSFSEWQRESQGLTKGNYFTDPEYGIIPCWSVGRLIEIMFKCAKCQNELTLTLDNYSINYILAVFEDAAKYGNIDFTKLN